jgi:ferritin-like metal-binding protein YciE
MKLSNLHDLYLHKLADLYSAEKQILEALPKMIDKASNRELTKALSDHLEQTRTQAERLDRINSSRQFDTAMKCKGIHGIIAEGSETIMEIKDTATRDAQIITAAQSVEHYEIAGYGSAKAFADELGFDEDADLLEQTLKEEGEADKLLSKIALGTLFKDGLNEKAQ